MRTKAHFPNSVWDGSSASRASTAAATAAATKISDPDSNKAPDFQDWDQISSEVKAVEDYLIALTNTVGALGLNSIVPNNDKNLALGLDSYAFGSGCQATGDYCWAVGDRCVAGMQPLACTISNLTVTVPGNSTSVSYNGGPIAITFNDWTNNKTKSFLTTLTADPTFDGTNTTFLLASNPVPENTSGFLVATDNYTGAHAEGQTTSAFSTNAHAENWSTIASGNSSHAEGANTRATAYFSHAEGVSSVADIAGSHAEGGGIFNEYGDCQYLSLVLKGMSNAASVVQLATTTSDPIPIKTGFTYGFRITVVGREAAGVNSAIFMREGLVTSTNLIGMQTIGTDINAAAWIVGIAVSGGNLVVSCNGVAGSANIYWTSKVELFQVKSGA